MQFSTLLLLPFSLVVFSHPLIVKHQAVSSENRIQIHGSQVFPRCVTVNNPRSLAATKSPKIIIPYTSSPSRPSNPEESFISRAISLFQSLHPLSRRDSVTISITQTANNTSICDSSNYAKFEVSTTSIMLKLRSVMASIKRATTLRLAIRTCWIILGVIPMAGTRRTEIVRLIKERGRVKLEGEIIRIWMGEEDVVVLVWVALFLQI